MVNYTRYDSLLGNVLLDNRSIWIYYSHNGFEDLAYEKNADTLSDYLCRAMDLWTFLKI